MRTAVSLMAILLIISLSMTGCKLKPKEEAGQPPATETAGKTDGPGKTVEITKDQAGLLSLMNDALASVAESVKPSVVNISTTKTVSIGDSPFGDFFNDPFFRKFFGKDFLPHGGKRQFKTSALGSGVIVTDDGYILTNNHVVQNVDEIKIILSDKREFTGKIIGSDPKTDLAILKVDASGLPALKFGNSSALRVGEMVIAVGNPFGLGNTITMGIVSAVGRSHVGISDYEDFIQTDAAINPGNSGGALVNIRAELVGINTAIFSTSGGNVGVGFAIPSSMAQSVMESIIKHGKVVRGWLGVSIQDLTPELARHFDIKAQKGALVTDVIKDSPAEKAGFRRGDLITEFDGSSVADSTGLRNRVAGTQPGKKVSVKVVREGMAQTISVVIGELSKIEATGQSSSVRENVLKGVYVQDVTPDIRKRLDIPQKVAGAVVASVDQDSPAAGLLRQHDVIQEVNRKEIRSAKDYETAASKVKSDESVLLLVFRGEGYIYVTITP